MRKFFLTLVLTVVLLLFLIVPTNIASAEPSVYEEIDIHVTVNEDGSAHFIERWYGHFYEGTEHYVKKENLQGATIRDFQVSEDGEPYTFVDPWNIDVSQEEKAFKYGIVPTDKGLELAWGVGEYGTHEYVLEYTVDDFILQLKDAQAIHWGFLDEGISTPRANVRIEIETPIELTEDDNKIWGFGQEGHINFRQGNIVLTSSEPLRTENYVVILTYLEDGSFTTDRTRNMTFKQLQKEAVEDSEYSLVTLGFFDTFLGSLVKVILQIIGIVLAFIGVSFILSRFNKKGTFLMQEPHQFKRYYPEEYYRDYPYQGDYLQAYFMTYRMGAANFNTLLTSLLLKWIYEDKIRMEETERGMLRRTQQTIHFYTDHHAPNALEGELYHMMKDHAKNNLMTDKDISRWATRNARKLRVWERKLLQQSAETLARDNLTTKIERKKMFAKQFFYQFTPEGKVVIGNIYRYINYLHDFSLLHEHDAINVKLWDEMMIWASYLNLTTVVMEQFKRMYPNYGIESKFDERSLRRSREMSRLASERRSQELKRQAEERARSGGRGGRTSSTGGGDAAGRSSGGGLR